MKRARVAFVLAVSTTACGALSGLDSLEVSDILSPVEGGTAPPSNPTTTRPDGATPPVDVAPLEGGAIDAGTEASFDAAADAGPLVSRTCSGPTCTCATGESCTFSCGNSKCSATAATGSKLDIRCSNGGCDVTCSGTAVCDVTGRNGDVEFTCRDQSTCTLSGGIGDLTTVCENSARCSYDRGSGSLDAICRDTAVCTVESQGDACDIACAATATCDAVDDCDKSTLP